MTNKKKMSDEIIVVYYSNYFPKTIEMKEYLQNSENVRTLNVDNIDVSRRILKDETYKIKFVPTILSLKEDGTIQIFEKDAAIQYYENIKQANETESEEAGQQEMYQMNPTLKASSKNEKTVQAVEEEEEDIPTTMTNMSIMDIAKAMENGRKG